MSILFEHCQMSILTYGLHFLLVLITSNDTYPSIENEENFDFILINCLDFIFISGEIKYKEKGI
jgi:hypothetical protein